MGSPHSLLDGSSILRRLHPALSSSSRGTSLSPARECGGQWRIKDRGYGGGGGGAVGWRGAYVNSLNSLRCEYADF